MKNFIKINTTILLMLLMFFSCTKKTDDTNIVPTPPVTTLGDYTLDGQLFSCTCHTDNLGYVFLKDKNNASNSFGIDRMPSASTGTFNFGKNFTGNTVLPMGYLLESRTQYKGYGSESGTITKTGARTFTFQCTLYDPLKVAKYQISGSGKY